LGSETGSLMTASYRMEQSVAITAVMHQDTGGRLDGSARLLIRTGRSCRSVELVQELGCRVRS
jgi:hypothetical protein